MKPLSPERIKLERSKERNFDVVFRMVMTSQATISIIRGVICSWRLEVGITVGIVHVIQHARVLAPELVSATTLMMAVFLDVKVQQGV